MKKPEDKPKFKKGLWLKFNHKDSGHISYVNSSNIEFIELPPLEKGYMMTLNGSKLEILYDGSKERQVLIDRFDALCEIAPEIKP